MRSDRSVGSRLYHQSINSGTVSRSGSNRKNVWPESYEEGQQRSRGPPRREDRNREDRNRGEDRNRNEDRNREDRNRNDDRSNRNDDRSNRNDDRNRDDRNRNDDRNRGINRQNDRYSEKSSLRGYGQRSDQRGRGRLSSEKRLLNGRNGQKNSVDENIDKNKSSQNSGSVRSKNSLSKTQSKLDSYAMSGDTSRRSGESRFGSRQSNRHLNSQKQEDNWESVSEPSDYETQQKNINRQQISRTYVPSSRLETFYILVL